MKSRSWSRHAIFILLVAGWVIPGRAQEYIRDKAPAPPSVDELKGPIIVAFPEPSPLPSILLLKAKESLQRFDPFIADLRLDLLSRSYYFLRDLDAEQTMSLGVPEKSEALATGGSIAVQTGWAWDHLALGGEFYTSLPVYAPDTRPGTGLLNPNQNSIFIVDQAHLRLRHNKQVVTLFRQRYDLPFINSRDSRMVPNSFEGYSIDGRWRHGRFIGGYVTKIKLRAGDNFIPMSTAAGVPDRRRGLLMAGMRFAHKDRFWVGMIGNYVPDLFSTIYSELDTKWKKGEWGYRVGWQFTHQRTVGDELLPGDSFDTQAVGLRLAASYRSAIVTTAYTVNSDAQRLRNPYGGSPSFTSMMLSDFNLANQKTFKLGVSYDFKRIGLRGFSGFVNYARGNSPMIAATGARLPDREEIDLTLDYRVKDRVPGSKWVRFRAAYLDLGESNRQVQYRVIFNWKLPLL